MIVVFKLVGGSEQNYIINNQGELNDLFRTIKGTKERGDIFLQLNAKGTKTNEVWLNVNNIIGLEVIRTQDSAEEESPIDDSNLLAVPKKLTPEELRAVQLIKQPMIPIFEAAQEREQDLREAQNLPGYRRGKK